MRLVSKFHDYYDGAIRTSVSDRSFVFVRKYEELGADRVQMIRFGYNKGKIDRMFEGGLIGFCGAIYPFVCVTDHKGRIGDLDYEATHEYFYDLDELLEIYPMDEDDSKYSKYHWFGKKKLGRLKEWFHDGTVTVWHGNHYSACNDSALKKIFTDHRIAYFGILPYGAKEAAYHRGAISVNQELVQIYPILKDVQFYRKFNPYTAFQTIEMYLTNELVKPDEINIVIPDKLKAQSKGFDKWSFRKMKEDNK